MASSPTLIFLVSMTLMQTVLGQMLPNPCPMNCYCSNLSVECMSLMEFPMTFPVDTKTLKLSQMNVRDIPPDAFSYMTQLEEIEFNNCNVQTLQGCSFAEMPSINKIRLVKTVIGSIERYAFRGLRNISLFELNSCRIGRIKPFAFYDTHKILTFIMFNTHIQNLYNAAFYNVSNVDRFTVSRGNFSDMVTGAFAHMSNILSMEMHMNQFWNMQCLVLEDIMAASEKLIFEQNSFYCNCSVFWLVNPIGRVKFQDKIEKNRCHGPDAFMNKTTLWHVSPTELNCGTGYDLDADRPCTRTVLVPNPKCPKMVDGVFEKEEEDKKDGDSFGIGLRYDFDILVSGLMTLVLLRI